MTTEVPTLSRRWFRFSLRTFFVVVTALCVWLGFQLQIVRSWQTMWKQIEASGGEIATRDAVLARGRSQPDE